MSRRDITISAFVVLWLGLFNYETFRLNYLSPLFGRELPKFKLLFPPAGWIMFYRVDEWDGRCEVFGLKGSRRYRIDPHRIFADRYVGYDNIRRNVLVTALERRYAPEFCRYLHRKFPEFEAFEVDEVVVPSVLEHPQRDIERPAYQCL
jgi:hypothetical protein